MTAEGIEVKVASKGSNLAQMESEIPTSTPPKNPLPAIAEATYDFASHKNPLIREFHNAVYNSEIITKEKLTALTAKFKDTKGSLAKDGPLTQVLEFAKDIYNKEPQQVNLHGPLFELEQAYKLESQGIKVTELGLKVPHKRPGANPITKIFDIDIVTEKSFIECKNWHWANKSDDVIKRLRERLLDLKKVAEQNGKTFELHSKSPLPNLFKEWLFENQIIFKEG